MINRSIIMGRLVRDPELRSTQSGVPVTNFTLAVDRDYKSQNGEKAVDFIDVIAWRQTAEFVCKYFGKGRMALVDGRLQAEKWTDKGGNSRTSYKVVTDSVYFADSKRSEGAATTSYTPPAPSYAVQGFEAMSGVGR